VTTQSTYSSTAPAAPATGDVWYDTTPGVEVWKRWNGAAWVLSATADINTVYTAIANGVISLASVPLTEVPFPATLTRDTELAAHEADTTNVHGIADTTLLALTTAVLALTGGTLAEAADIILGTVTGTKIGTAANQKLGFYGAPPVIRPAALTQTYATASRTNPALTSAAVATTASTAITPNGYTTTAQADAIPVAINALRADVNNIKSFVNAIADDLQLVGMEA